MKFVHLCARALAAVAAAGLLAASALAADLPPMLFGTPAGTTAGPTTGPAAPPGPAIARQRTVAVDFGLIDPRAPTTPAELAVELFDGRFVTLDRARVEVRAPGNYTWYGRVRGFGRSDAVLTVVDGYVAGSIVVVDAEARITTAYEVLTGRDGTTWLRELDPAGFPPEHPEGSEGLAIPPQGPGGALPAPEDAPVVAADSGSTVDVMVVYSNQTAVAAGAGIVAQIQQAVDRANLAYTNSAIAPRLRLVHYAQVNYNESGNFNTDLDRLTNTADGYMDEVHAWRNAYAADLVSLFIENGAYCGLGWLNSSAAYGFTAVNRGCAGGNLSFAHELGHNFGAHHDPYVATNGTYPYGHGYVYTPAKWRTVMAYNDACSGVGGCTRITYFSNPDVTYGNPAVATGTIATHDNARVHDERANAVANFRQAVASWAPSVATIAGSGLTATGATLNGLASSNGAATTATFQYGTTTSYGGTATASQSPLASNAAGAAVSAAVTGLACNTLYHYRVVGANGAGTTNGGDWTFTTAACPVGVPAVTTTAATAVVATAATLNGTVSSNGSSTTVTFQYGTTTSYGSTATAAQSPLAAGASGAAVSAAIAGLVCNTQYHFRVVGANGSGTTNGGDLTFTTAACPATAPTVTTAAASSVGATGATLNGTVSSNGSSTTVTFQYGTTTSYGSTATAAQSPLAAGASGAAVSAAISGLVCNTQYHFRVVGANGSGTTNGGDLTFTTAACSATVPTVATAAATAISTTGATLNGTVSSNGASTTVTFQYGTTTSYGSTATAAQSPLAAGASGAAVSAAIGGLACNTPYHFRAVGANGAGTTAGGDFAFTTAACTGTSSTTTLASNANPSTTGTIVTYTATVTGAAPTGSVAFLAGGSPIAGCGAVALGGSGNTRTATCATDTLPVGTQSIVASYAGNGLNAPSASAPLAQQVVAPLPITATVIANPYGVLTVTGGTLVGNLITLTSPTATIQLGPVAGVGGSQAQIDFQGLHVGAGNTLTIRSGAAGQFVMLRNVAGTGSAIGGTLQAQGGNGAPPPGLYVWSPSGIAIAGSGNVTSPAGLTVDALDVSWTVGQNLTNGGRIDGGGGLALLGANVRGGGAFVGDSIGVHTFGNAHNPANGADFLQNGLQLSTASAPLLALTLNGYGQGKQVFNLKVNGNATLWMPSAWPAGASLPANSAVVAPGATRPSGVPEPAYGGGSMIVQATGNLALRNGGTNDFAFPGAIALKAGGTLDFNGVAVNQGWTTTGQSFQGLFFEAPSIVSANGLIRLYGNDLNWMNFSVLPQQYVRAFSLKRNPDGSASFAAADGTAPHLNTYSMIQGAAAAGGCWVCLVNTAPVNMYGP